MDTNATAPSLTSAEIAQREIRALRMANNANRALVDALMDRCAAAEALAKRWEAVAVRMAGVSTTQHQAANSATSDAVENEQAAIAAQMRSELAYSIVDPAIWARAADVHRRANETAGKPE